MANHIDDVYHDVGYGEYKSVTHYTLEPSIIGELKAKARAKLQVILMLQREYDEILEEIGREVIKSNLSQG
jgi:hypothetical protein